MRDSNTTVVKHEQQRLESQQRANLLATFASASHVVRSGPNRSDHNVQILFLSLDCLASRLLHVWCGLPPLQTFA
jgi:hypothetical protein